MLSGNRGEWSEIYVLLKLLADGRLNAADENLNVLENVYYPVLKIIRNEVEKNREYIINGNIKIINADNDESIAIVPISTFLNKANDLFNKISNAEGSAFSIHEIEEFLREIDVTTLSASSNNKTDITLVVHDLNTGTNPRLGFSIKSMLGQNSTLFNPGKTTNFIFKIIGDRLTNRQINTINALDEQPKIKNRINELIQMGYRIKFDDVESNTLKLNLQLIDGDLPKILGYLTLYKYSNSINRLVDLIDKLKADNPLNYDLSQNHPFYDYKIKNFLTDVALGMTPAAPWSGHYSATGGIIIVKQDGDVVCYHIYNRNEFQSYLLNHTKLEQASMTRYDFGEIYLEQGNPFIKLNLQVRFI